MNVHVILAQGPRSPSLNHSHFSLWAFETSTELDDTEPHTVSKTV